MLHTRAGIQPWKIGRGTIFDFGTNAAALAGGRLRSDENGALWLTDGSTLYHRDGGTWRRLVPGAARQASGAGSDPSCLPSRRELADHRAGRAGGLATRQMAEGRFNDDVVTGLLATGSDQGGVFYLVPTRAVCCASTPAAGRTRSTRRASRAWSLTGRRRWSSSRAVAASSISVKRRVMPSTTPSRSRPG